VQIKDEFGETVQVGDRVVCAINEHEDNSDDVETYRGVVREITDRAVRIEVSDARNLGSPSFEGDGGEYRIGEVWYCHTEYDGMFNDALASWHQQFAKAHTGPDEPVFADPNSWHHYREFGPLIKVS